MPVAYRKLVLARIPYSRVDFEIVYKGREKFDEQWFVFDYQSGTLLSLGCRSAWFAWKVAYENLDKGVAQINKINKANAVLPH